MTSNGKVFAPDGRADATSSPRMRLTPEQRHHLLKSLVCAEMLDEWALLDEEEGLKQYGPPFVNNGASIPDQVGHQHELYPEHCKEPVILLHLFHVHLRRFPGLHAADVSYWRQRIIPFFDKISKGVFSNCQERSELTNRKVLAFVATRYIATFWTRGIGIRGVGETKGPGRGEPGSDKWGVGKQWGKGTVKRGLERPARPSKRDRKAMSDLFRQQEDGQGNDDDEILWDTAGQNVHRIKSDWSSWKESIIETEGGLDKTLELLETKSIRNLPAEYQNAIEWVRRHVAFVLWTVFVQYPGGDEILSIIKTIHALFPYWGAKQLLKIANAQKMIKAIVDLLLARPLGMVDSLGQRIFFAVMNNEISSISKNFLTPLKRSINEDELCELFDNYVKTRTNEQRYRIMQNAREKNQDTIVSILEEYHYTDMDSIRGMQSEYLNSPFRGNLDWAYPTISLANKNMTTRPPSDILDKSRPRAIKFAQLKLYLRERLRKRDREKVLEIGTGQLVPDIIKDSLQIVFYKIIYEIALVADLSSRLGDLQRFVDDLIVTKTKKMDNLEEWIALCARHEDSLYIFVHEIRTAIEPVFDWCQEALDYMALSTTEPWNPSNRKVSHVEINLDDLLDQASKDMKVDVKEVIREVDSIVDFSKWYKIDQEIQMRKEYVNIRADSISNVTKIAKRGQRSNSKPTASEEMESILDDKGELTKSLMNGQGVEWDDGLVHSLSRGTECGSLPWGFFGTDDLLHQHYDAEEEDPEPLRYAAEDRIMTKPPTLSHIRSLLPSFRAVLKKRLPDWQFRAIC